LLDAAARAGCKCCKIRKSIPHPSEKLQHTIDTIHLSVEDLAQLFELFKQHDKDNSNAIDLDEFYAILDERRSVFADGLFDLIDADDTGTLDFSEFVVTIMTYGLFEELEVLKYCFFVFDKDKNGYIEEDEMHALVDVLHDHEVKGNLKTAEDLTLKHANSDGKIDFMEFQTINKQFPTLLYPAYRLQRNLWKNVLGEKWWVKKQTELNDERVAIRERCNVLRIKEEKRLRAIVRRQMWRRFGNVYGCFYYACPWMCCQYTTMDRKITKVESEAELTGEGHIEAEGTQKQTVQQYDDLVKKYGYGFMKDPEVLRQVNRHYNDRAALYNDGLAFRRSNRKERARERRNYRVEMAF